MEDKTEISYWFKESEESKVEILIMRTMTSKVPDVGEIIHINTIVDEDWLNNSFNHLPDFQKKAFFPLKEKQIKGKFVVKSVNRYIKTEYFSKEFHSVFHSQSTGVVKGPEIPAECIHETFEVFIEPFKHSDLTESPIAKVRNLLGSVFGAFDILNTIKANPDKEQELMELFKSSLETANESIPKLRELLKDNKNWK